ncbi:peptidylprolyl isomerase [Frisingicoccus sp.]|uniref:peptidylprolyl isomerase n=1 Tax=Frisingicoccus sp. TaxID=1918627 RepID=UPI002EB71DD2|nr:peptidylprolyl isomerase [Frisingicoccus sp.]
MSDNEKKMTRYDMKMQRRQQGGQKTDGGVRLLALGCIAFLVFCVGVFAWKTYQTHQEKNETYVTIGEHEVKKAEYDYYFYSGINSLYSYYGDMLSYMGLDLSKPLDEQNFSEDMTWQEYFDEQAVMQMKQVYALSDELTEAGFEYDATEDVNDFVDSLKTAAVSAGATSEAYLKASYGSFATIKEVERLVERDSIVDAYYNDIMEGIEVTDDEITAYYEDNKDNYDSVDYMIWEVAADIPETEEETVDETETEDETAETLSEEEQAELEAQKAAEEEAVKEAAMADAEVKANDMLDQITDQESFETLCEAQADEDSIEYLKTNVKMSSVTPTTVASWLFDSERQTGDKTVIEYSAGNAYYVVYFLNRYLDETKTVDVRHILIPSDAETTDEMTEEEIAAATEDAKAAALEKAESIYEEWQEGEATEDSFAALAEANSTDTGSSTNGGLYEAVTYGQMVDSFNDWIFDDERKAGDTDIVETEYGYHIMYFVGDNGAAWKLSIEDTLRSQKMNEYVTALVEPMEVVYAKQPETEETETSGETTAETTEDTTAETTAETVSESVEETEE